MFLSFPETNLSSAEKASVKDEGRLLTDCAYEALTLWAGMFLKFLVSLLSTELHLANSKVPYDHTKRKI